MARKALLSSEGASDLSRNLGCTIKMSWRLF